jgi:hypothetical protein
MVVVMVLFAKRLPKGGYAEVVDIAFLKMGSQNRYKKLQTGQ